MKNMRYIYIIALTFALLSIASTKAKAQEQYEWLDSVEVSDEELAEWDSLDNHMFIDDANTDSAVSVRYVIEKTPDHKWTLYDSSKDTVLIEDMDYLKYSHSVQAASDSSIYCYFYFEKGIRSGVIGINMETCNEVTISQDNPSYVADISKCTTIDTTMTMMRREYLSDGLKSLNGIYGQLAIVDIPTGQLRTWIALRRNEKGYEDDVLQLSRLAGTHLLLPLSAVYMLVANGISPNDSVDTGNGVYNAGNDVTIKDHNWRKGGYGKISFIDGFMGNSNIAMFKTLEAAKDENPVETWSQMSEIREESNAMQLAVYISSLYCGNGKIYTPSLIGDSVTVQGNTANNQQFLKYVKDILVGLNTGNGVQSLYAPKGISIAGIYGIAGNLSTKTDDTVNQASFGGCIPADNSRYAIGIFIDTPQGNTITKQEFSKTVNKIIEYLAKK